MIETTGKVHIRDTTTNRADFIQSPHIYRAIKDGRFTVCRTIMPDERVTSDIDKVNCIACLRRVAKQAEFLDRIVTLGETKF